MKRPWMPFYVGDYLADTGHLSTVEHGAYLLLIMHYWTHGKALPDDDRKLASIARLLLADWQAIRPTIQEFFSSKILANGSCWVHKRVEQELAKADNKYNIRVTSGRKGGLAKARVLLGVCSSKTLPTTTTTTLRKKDGADAPALDNNTAEKELFDRGKAVLGKNSGGLIRKVLKAKGENVALARAAIEQASTKQNPLEYAGRIAAGPPDNTSPGIREREKQPGFYARFDSPEQRAWEKHTGKSPRDRDGGWLYPAQWPEAEHERTSRRLNS